MGLPAGADRSTPLCGRKTCSRGWYRAAPKPLVIFPTTGRTTPSTGARELASDWRPPGTGHPAVVGGGRPPLEFASAAGPDGAASRRDLTESSSVRNIVRAAVSCSAVMAASAARADAKRLPPKVRSRTHAARVMSRRADMTSVTVGPFASDGTMITVQARDARIPDCIRTTPEISGCPMKGSCQRVRSRPPTEWPGTPERPRLRAGLRGVTV